MIEEFTLSIFTENYIGLLNRVVSIFTRRHINIESVNASPSSLPGIYRYTFVVNVTEVQVKKLIGQFEKQVDVLKAFYHKREEIVYQEIALYKVPTDAFMHGDRMERLIRDNNARILSIEPQYIVIEKTGHQEETQQFLERLRPYGVYEFVRSGRVAISKPMEQLNEHLKKVEAQMALSNGVK